ncbi:hypothetical protein BESB_032700 [Besnoitia besnoiti]|uniref:Uncharacterized protein n=1 Tax=Besnoitia besnoiti TaxID=94643 RepID=A0A2A9M5Z4_BESBE|nr:uncharacterized protein BESB_032700 [Besnoitia besnoiti]PFH31073.1 hypothetical protein BESB_032700 [Besnoitia besnoiti]
MSPPTPRSSLDCVLPCSEHRCGPQPFLSALREADACVPPPCVSLLCPHPIARPKAAMPSAYVVPTSLQSAEGALRFSRARSSRGGPPCGSTCEARLNTPSRGVALRPDALTAGDVEAARPPFSAGSSSSSLATEVTSSCPREYARKRRLGLTRGASMTVASSRSTGSEDSSPRTPHSGAASLLNSRRPASWGQTHSAEAALPCERDFAGAAWKPDGGSHASRLGSCSPAGAGAEADTLITAGLRAVCSGRTEGLAWPSPNPASAEYNSDAVGGVYSSSIQQSTPLARTSTMSASSCHASSRASLSCLRTFTPRSGGRQAFEDFATPAPGNYVHDLPGTGAWPPEGLRFQAVRGRDGAGDGGARFPSPNLSYETASSGRRRNADTATCGSPLSVGRRVPSAPSPRSNESPGGLPPYYAARRTERLWSGAESACGALKVTAHRPALESQTAAVDSLPQPRRSPAAWRSSRALVAAPMLSSALVGIQSPSRLSASPCSGAGGIRCVLISETSLEQLSSVGTPTKKGLTTVDAEKLRAPATATVLRKRVKDAVTVSASGESPAAAEFPASAPSEGEERRKSGVLRERNREESQERAPLPNGSGSLRHLQLLGVNAADQVAVWTAVRAKMAERTSANRSGSRTPEMNWTPQDEQDSVDAVLEPDVEEKEAEKALSEQVDDAQVNGSFARNCEALRGDTRRGKRWSRPEALHQLEFGGGSWDAQMQEGPGGNASHIQRHFIGVQSPLASHHGNYVSDRCEGQLSHENGGDSSAFNLRADCGLLTEPDAHRAAPPPTPVRLRSTAKLDGTSACRLPAAVWGLPVPTPGHRSRAPLNLESFSADVGSGLEPQGTLGHADVQESPLLPLSEGIGVPEADEQPLSDRARYLSGSAGKSVAMPQPSSKASENEEMERSWLQEELQMRRLAWQLRQEQQLRLALLMPRGPALPSPASVVSPIRHRSPAASPRLLRECDPTICDCGRESSWISPFEATGDGDGARNSAVFSTNSLAAPCVSSAHKDAENYIRVGVCTVCEPPASSCQLAADSFDLYHQPRTSPKREAGSAAPRPSTQSTGCPLPKHSAPVPGDLTPAGLERSRAVGDLSTRTGSADKSSLPYVWNDAASRGANGGMPPYRWPQPSDSELPLETGLSSGGPRGVSGGCSPRERCRRTPTSGTSREGKRGATRPTFVSLSRSGLSKRRPAPLTLPSMDDGAAELPPPAPTSWSSRLRMAAVQCADAAAGSESCSETADEPCASFSLDGAKATPIRAAEAANTRLRATSAATDKLPKTWHAPEADEVGSALPTLLGRRPPPLWAQVDPVACTGWSLGTRKKNEAATNGDKRVCVQGKPVMRDFAPLRTCPSSQAKMGFPGGAHIDVETEKLQAADERVPHPPLLAFTPISETQMPDRGESPCGASAHIMDADEDQPLHSCFYPAPSDRSGVCVARSQLLVDTPERRQSPLIPQGHCGSAADLREDDALCALPTEVNEESEMEAGQDRTPRTGCRDPILTAPHHRGAHRNPLLGFAAPSASRGFLHLPSLPTVFR